MSENEIFAIDQRPEITRISADGNMVTLNWTTQEGIDKYIIRRSLSSAEGFEKIAVLSGDTSEYCDKNEGDGVYWYKVVAVRYSPEKEVIKKGSKVKSVTLCSLVSPTAEKISSGKKGKIILKWSYEEKADYFEVFKRYSFMNTHTYIGSVEGNKTSFADDNCIKGQLFYYSVTACVKEGETVKRSAHSNELCFVAFDKVPILEINRKHRKTVLFSLRLTAGADGYLLLRSDEENGEYKEVFRSCSVSDLILKDKGEKRKKGAFYKVACFKKTPDGDFIGPLSDSVFVKYKI
ncbi:MAG: hypothetical protein IJ262_02875 [Clostridia bacterium]|nr:hypothetical protein [Clostridia bacterium]